jgi:hypothetical protein
MPGEAAAVAAFREARPQALRSAGLASGSVRNQRALRRLPGLGRPLRLGFVVALAGCALGGAAVAVTTGALPIPFGGSDGGLKPASSAPHPQSPQGRGATVTGSGEPSTPLEDDEQAGSNGPDASAKPSPSSRGAAGAGRDSDGRSGSDGAAGRAPTYPPPSSEQSQRTAALCRSYANDTLDRRDRKRLESTAGGAAKVSRYCQRQGGGSGDTSGSGSSAGSGTSGGTSNSAGSGDSGGGNDGGDRGSAGDQEADGADPAGHSGGAAHDRP